MAAQTYTRDIAINTADSKCQYSTIGHRIGENRSLIDTPIHFDPEQLSIWRSVGE